MDYFADTVQSIWLYQQVVVLNIRVFNGWVHSLGGCRGVAPVPHKFLTRNPRGVTLTCLCHHLQKLLLKERERAQSLNTLSCYILGTSIMLSGPFSADMGTCCSNHPECFECECYPALMNSLSRLLPHLSISVELDV